VKITLKHVLVMMLLMPKPLVWGASEVTWGNGLETDNTTQLQVLIEEITEAGRKIGLTGERIEARVNQSLRKAGITPVSLETGLSGGRLYVNVNVMANGSFGISIEFSRQVFYRSGDKWLTKSGYTWNQGMVGYGPSRDFILDGVAEIVEVFCNEFLKANGK
jgi:hypothetical protein